MYTLVIHNPSDAKTEPKYGEVGVTHVEMNLFFFSFSSLQHFSRTV